MMKYNVNITYSERRPYYFTEGKDKRKIKHTSVTEYEGLTREMLNDVLKEELDFPDEKLTVEDIKKDFSSGHEWQVSDEDAQDIADYYAGRFELNQKIQHKLQGLNHGSLAGRIPDSCREFLGKKNPEVENLASFIEIEAIKEEGDDGFEQLKLNLGKVMD